MLRSRIKTFLFSEKSKNLFLIISAQVVFILVTLYINFKIEKIWGAEGFASYGLFKRISSFIVFPLVFGCGIAIPRFIASLKNNQKTRSVEYLMSGTLIFISTFSIFSLILICIPGIVTTSFNTLGISNSIILGSFILFILSQGLYILVFSYFRGLLQFNYSTVLNIIIMSLIPMFLLFHSTDVFEYFTIIGALSLVSILALIGILVLKSKPVLSNIKGKVFELFNYGGRRVLGEISLFSIEFMPVFLVSLYIDLIQSGYITMALLIIKIGSMFFELIGSMVLPYFSKMYENISNKEFCKNVNKLLVYGLITSLIVSIIFFLSSEYVVQRFFPTQYYAVNIIKPLAFVFPFYVIYLLLRNIIDVVSVKAYNSINLFIVSIVQVAVIFVGVYYEFPFFYFTLPLMLAYFLAGTLSSITWLKLKSKLK